MKKKQANDVARSGEKSGEHDTVNIVPLHNHRNCKWVRGWFDTNAKKDG